MVQTGERIVEWRRARSLAPNRPLPCVINQPFLSLPTRLNSSAEPQRRSAVGLTTAVMADVLAPFRKNDAEESMKLIEKNGFDRLHMAFYKGHDVGNDGVWDVWQIEGPAMVWYFRGDPHVHTWVHIRESA